MFGKLALSSPALFFAITGFISMFAVNVMGGQTLYASFVGAAFGALGFFLVWLIFAMILTILFTEEEIQKIFSGPSLPARPSRPGPSTEYKLPASSEGELTPEELYAPQSPNPDKSFPSENLPSFAQNPPKNSSQTDSTLDTAGNFNFEANNRVLRTNVKEAAQAARKVLMTERLNNEK